MLWELWGGLVTVVGLLWMYTGEVKISIEGREPFYCISGVPARLAGAAILTLGICLVLFC